MASFREIVLEHGRQAHLSDFEKLMQWQVREVLLLSSPYDSFILSEDGKLQEMMLSGYLDYNISSAPGITRVSSGSEALNLSEDCGRFNLIITTMHISDMKATEFSVKLRAKGIHTPLILLNYDNNDLADLAKSGESALFNRIFSWQGDFRIFLTIIKYVEDMMNVDLDNSNVGVQVIILVEDSIRYYSSYLPLLYTELFRHSSLLIQEEPSSYLKLLRMRSRPKILLAVNYESAIAFFEKYRNDVLGVISDMRFPVGEILDSQAGLKLTEIVKRRDPDIPVLLQSSSRTNEASALSAGAMFIWKESPTLLGELGDFIKENFHFSDFVFRMPDGREVARAHDLGSLVEALKSVPIESVLFHAGRNHFSNWLKARTEFILAASLKPRKNSDYNTPEDHRRDLIDSLEEARQKHYRGKIVDFNPDDFGTVTNIARIGSGSIGGKARGLAFVSKLLNKYDIRNRFQNIKIFIPGTVVVCTDVFTQFMEDNNLRDFALSTTDENEINRTFQKASFPEQTLRDLRKFLSKIRHPLAIRSSSILEDSLHQPFAGVYGTYMISNDEADPESRVDSLVSAIKGVYASMFSRTAKDYIRATSYRLEEEKMAVIIQRIIGNRFDDRYYPHFSGVARSRNSYPMPPMKSEDGIVTLALGLGKSVVDGMVSLNICPKYPGRVIGWNSARDYLQFSQKKFFAVPMNHGSGHTDPTGGLSDQKLFDIETAEKDGMLDMLGSTYEMENDKLSEGISRTGIRVVSFAPILKDKSFPVTEILQIIMDMGEWGMSKPVEIEFAANLNPQTGGPRQFGILQMRPLVMNAEQEDLKIDDFQAENSICYSRQVMGNGRIDNILDLVIVDRNGFDRSKSMETAGEIAEFNRTLLDEDRPYILIGIGRWGSADPWLGIPVKWSGISGAKAIVESGFNDMKVQPSQGSHFFHNLSSFNIGYFTVNENEKSFIDWDWLAKQKPIASKKYCRLLRFKDPLIVKINGRTNEGVILKPGG